MKILCAGFSKTGTKSLAEALRILGFTVFDHLEHYEFHFNEWVDLYCEGKIPDFVAMYKDIDAVIGLPASFWFEEIREAFPDTKVVLTLRDNEDVWVQSWEKQMDFSVNSDGFFRRFVLNLPFPIFTGQSFHRHYLSFLYPSVTAAFGSMNPKSTPLAKKKYREHNQRVQAIILKEKLLIYNVKQGWKPLCEFVGCNVPDQDFPRKNVGLSLIKSFYSEGFQRLKRNVFFSVAIFVLLLGMLYLVYY